MGFPRYRCKYWHHIHALTHREFSLLPDLNSSTYLPLHLAKIAFRTLFHFYPKLMRPIFCMFLSRVTPFLNSQMNNSRSTKESKTLKTKKTFLFMKGQRELIDGDKWTFRWFFRRVVEKPLVRPSPQRSPATRTYTALWIPDRAVSKILVNSFISIRVRSMQHEDKLGLSLNR